MTIDISKIKPGDEVLVRCVATAFKSKDDIYVDLRTHRFFVQQDHIAGHTPAPPKPLGVGDRVRRHGSSTIHDVVAGPTERADGRVEVALWNVDAGYFCDTPNNLERVS